MPASLYIFPCAFFPSLTSPSESCPPSLLHCSLVRFFAPSLLYSVSCIPSASMCRAAPTPSKTPLLQYSLPPSSTPSPRLASPRLASLASLPRLPPSLPPSDPNANLYTFTCPHGMVLNGLYRTSENDLGGISKFKCCSVGPSATGLLNAGQNCWGACQSQQGPCAWCGSGSCCRKGLAGNGCDGLIGDPDHHVCSAVGPPPAPTTAGTVNLAPA
jgi:hypothetical protein